MNEGAIPPAALRDKHAVEMLRVWVAEQGLHCSLKMGMAQEMGIVEEEPQRLRGVAGTILADAARHVARALSSQSGLEEGVVLDNLRARLLAELAHPSSPMKGGVNRS